MLIDVLIGVFFRKRHRFCLPGKTLRRAGFCSSIFFAALIIFGICPITPSDNDMVDAAAKSSNTSLTMTTNYESARLDIVPTDLAGSFATSPNDKVAKFGITTDNATGYKLTIKEKTTTNSGKLVSSNGSYLSSISTATTASGFNNGEWGYKPSKYIASTSTWQSLSGDNYLKSPTTEYTLDETSTKNSTAQEYSIGLGAKVDYSKPAGNYTNTFVLAAVGNPITYTINYADATSDSTISGIPAQQSSSTIATSVTLSNATPTRTGYTFAGWCYGTVNTTGTHPGTTCSGTPGTTHAASSSLAFIDQTATGSNVNTITLQALWTANVYNVYESIMYPVSSNFSVTGNNMTLTYDASENKYTLNNIDTKYDPYATAPQTVYLTAGTTYTMHADFETIDGEPITSSSRIMQVFYAIDKAFNQSESVMLSGVDNTQTFTPSATGLYNFRLDNDYNNWADDIVVKNFSVGYAKEVTYGSTYGTLATPTMLGYTFVNWSDATSGGNTITSSSTVSAIKDHVLFARWTANTYNITYLGGEIYTGFDNTTQTLAQGSSVPVVTSNVLNLSARYSKADKGCNCY